jgi:hypothetical protein
MFELPLRSRALIAFTVGGLFRPPGEHRQPSGKTQKSPQYP